MHNSPIETWNLNKPNSDKGFFYSDDRFEWNSHLIAPINIHKMYRASFTINQCISWKHSYLTKQLTWNLRREGGEVEKSRCHRQFIQTHWIFRLQNLPRLTSSGHSTFWAIHSETQLFWKLVCAHLCHTWIPCICWHQFWNTWEKKSQLRSHFIGMIVMWFGNRIRNLDTCWPYSIVTSI